MKNLWTTTRVPVSVLKDAETIKEHEKTIKTLKRENAHLMSTLTGTEEKMFPQASEQKTIAKEKRDKNLAGIRAVLAHRVREKIIENTLEGHMNVFIYVREFGFFDDEILKKYSDDDIMEPIIKSLREEGYQVKGGLYKEGYQVSWN